jgi:outer membrane protein insertion porin family
MRAMDRLLLMCGCCAILTALPPWGATVQAQGSGSEVSDVIVRGSRLTRPEYIKSLLRTRPGSPYRPETIQDDVRTIMGTGRFANVKTYVEEDGPGKKKVVFELCDPTSRVEKVIYFGNKHLSTEDLDELTGIRKGTPLNPHRNRMACRKIEARYHEQGRLFAHCELVSGGRPGDTKVVYRIAEGPKLRVRSINFTGHTFIGASRLNTVVHSQRYLIPWVSDMFKRGVYNPAIVEADVHQLEKYYRSFGYHDVKIRPERRLAPGGGMIDLVYHIHEGVRYRLKGPPDVSGNQAIPKEPLQAMSDIRSGDYYNEKQIQTDVRHISDYYGLLGRKIAVRAEPIYSRDEPGLMQVVYQVQESLPARVGNVHIEGNTRTRQNVILRQVPLYPGQILQYPKLLEAERNLARLGIFESSPDGAIRPTVEVLDDPLNPNSPYKDILINVQEANTGSLLFGLGVTSSSGLTGNIVLNERNFDLFRPPTSLDDLLSGRAFRGAGQEFRLELVPGTQLQRYTITFREPYLFDSPYSLTTSGYYYTRYFNEYTEQRVGARATIGRKLSNSLSVRTGVRVEGVNVSDVPNFAPQDYLEVVGDNFQVGFNGGIIFDTRDSYLRPSEGARVELSYEEVLGDRTFPLINLNASKYFTVHQRADGSGRHVVALNSRVGWAGTNTPVYERFFAGGFRTLRGFQFRGVGPQVNGFKTGGDFLLLGSAEYQIPLTARDQVHFVTFVDTGTVAPRIDEIDNFRVSVGFGFRFMIPMFGPVPIAVDFGFPIVKGPFDNEQVFNFFMGITR